MSTEALESGCSDDSECPTYNACENQLCIDPCILHDPCGKFAKCSVINHDVICTCPDGYIGDPNLDCRLRKWIFYFILRNCMQI